MGTKNGSAIVTLVERVTRYLILVHLPGGVPTIAGLRDGITTAVAHLPVTARRSLTWDQGKELGGHAQITADGAGRVLLRRALTLAVREQREHERVTA